MSHRLSGTLLLLLLGAAAGNAAPPANFKVPPLEDILPLLDARSPDALEGVLRSALIQFLPNPLYEASPNWGKQRPTAHALHWHRKGLLLRPEIRREPRNDGTWRKYVLTSRNLPDTLIIDIRQVQFPEPLRMQFELFLSFDAAAEYTHHVWESGVRLYAGSVRARFRAKLTLQCEATARLEPTKSIVPDAVFTVQVVKARLGYDNLVVEHIPGIGGSAARLLGRAFHEALDQWHPSVERGLLERANAAILRAGHTREVRISLGRIFAKAFPAQ